MSKLLEKTAQLQPGQHAPTRQPGTLSAPARMFDITTRINDAEDRATAAAAETAEAKKQLDEARRQIEDLQQAGPTATTLEVDISTLVEVPGRKRILSPTERQELRDNLAKNPLTHPIVYRPLGDGRNEIVSGNNRVEIYRDDLGRTKILGIPFTGDAKSAELGATFSNLLAPSLPDYEKYRQFVRLQDESGFTRADIIEASGLSTSHVSRILAFDKLPVAARTAIAARPDRLGGHAAEEFASLAANGNDDAVIKAIEALVANEKMSQKQALEMAKPKVTKPPVQPARTINVGRKKLCDVSVRSGVIGLRFSGKEGKATAQRWAEKIEEYIRREAAAEEGS
ncbi:hypothetical protein R69746_08456 [Paraburkholderia aspalathi]|uniref:ParB/RepB/Spo0J family partition protein n=1 Tax=Paraburkholderia aspalathi TaxID=1324617 RepID=UPI00190BF535|nr:chromosome partitioning protein ParB [Paraburkholderia aspalathi]MBK3844215.1 chromosome partitioning protein ParB [Paraburkholderia aspalathi]CAE6870330.1 hypothetical protein R75465_08242 [Paraburkholderia aspalathi]CAE6871367.1 hypothetical protein R69746_08456 [Paraburkholderia aspalathi]